MKAIKDLCGYTKYTPKEQQYFLDCLKEMECIEFVEQLIAISNQRGYDEGYEDGFEAGKGC